MPHPVALAHLAAVTTGAARTHPASTSWSVFVEDAAHVAALQPLLAAGRLGPEAAVFVPEADADAAARPAGTAVIAYRGSLSRPGDRLWLDDSFVMEVQSYAVAGFLAVHGPTLLRLSGPEDLLAVATDAATARDTGRFPRVAAGPAVQLADTPALGWPAPGEGSLRMYVRADGSIGTSPAGARLAHVDSLDELTPQRIATADPRAALAEVVGPGVLAAALAEVPWLPRYLAVVAAVRATRSRGVEVEAVSGFGARLDDAIPLEDGTRLARRPVIAIAADSAVVVDPVTGRAVFLDTERARALEAAIDGSGHPLGADLSQVLAGRGFGGLSAEAVAA